MRDFKEETLKLEARILNFYMSLKGDAKKKFAEEFNITSVRQGRI